MKNQCKSCLFAKGSEKRDGQQHFFPPEIPSLGVSFLGPRRVLLGGSYTPRHTSTKGSIAYASGFWSKDQNDCNLFSCISNCNLESDNFASYEEPREQVGPPLFSEKQRMKR